MAKTEFQREIQIILEVKWHGLYSWEVLSNSNQAGFKDFSKYSVLRERFQNWNL
jgi:hypothetical protein